MGIPVLSLKVNPGGIFDKYNFGVCFKGDLEKMKEYIGCNAMNSFDRKEMTSYIGEFHDFNTAAERFVDSLNSAV